MKKTNIRIRNDFLFEDGNEYFLSSIKDIETWKKLQDENFNKYKGKDITTKVKELMKKYDICVNVNFHDDDEDNITRTIEIKMDKGGG